MKKKNGFTFIETIITTVMLITTLLLVYKSYSGVLISAKQREKYDQTSYIYRAKTFTDYLQNEYDSLKSVFTQSGNKSYIIKYECKDNKCSDIWRETDIKQLYVVYYSAVQGASSNLKAVFNTQTYEKSLVRYVKTLSYIDGQEYVGVIIHYNNDYFAKLELKKTVESKNTHTVTFDLNGGDVPVGTILFKDVPDNTYVTKLSVEPTKANCNFKEWQLSGNTFNFNITKIVSDINLMANYDCQSEPEPLRRHIYYFSCNTSLPILKLTPSDGFATNYFVPNSNDYNTTDYSYNYQGEKLLISKILSDNINNQHCGTPPSNFKKAAVETINNLDQNLYTASENGIWAIKGRVINNEQRYIIYFRGGVKNNFVKITDKDGVSSRWRIVRINDDHTIRLVLWSFSDKEDVSTLWGENELFKYKNVMGDQYLINNQQILVKSINDILQEIYTNRLSPDKLKLDNPDIKLNIYDKGRYCIEGSLVASVKKLLLTNRYFAAGKRFIINNTNIMLNTTCAGADSNSADGTAWFKTNIGLLSADEMIMAGATFNAKNQRFFLYHSGYYTPSLSWSSTMGNNNNLLSKERETNYILMRYGQLRESPDLKISYKLNLYPTIDLKPCTRVISGNGEYSIASGDHSYILDNNDTVCAGSEDFERVNGNE